MKWYKEEEIDWDKTKYHVVQCSFCQNMGMRPRTNSILTCPECLKKGKPKTRHGFYGNYRPHPNI